MPDATVTVMVNGCTASCWTIEVLCGSSKRTCTAVMGASSGSLKGRTASTTLSSRPGSRYVYGHTRIHIGGETTT
jgi:hypothetical protein